MIYSQFSRCHQCSLSFWKSLESWLIFFNYSLYYWEQNRRILLIEKMMSGCCKIIQVFTFTPKRIYRFLFCRRRYTLLISRVNSTYFIFIFLLNWIFLPLINGSFLYYLNMKCYLWWFKRDLKVATLQKKLHNSLTLEFQRLLSTLALK